MERHDTLLIACGSRESRLQLRSALEKRFNLLEASNTRQMILLLEQNLDCIASVVLDISNWDVIDKELQTDKHAVSLLKQIPVIVVADKESYQDLTLYFRYGEADVLPLNYDPFAMLHRIETITQLTLHRKHLENIVDEQTENLRRFSDNMVDALSAIIEFRNNESGHHILRIRNFTRILLQELMRHCPEYELTPRLVTMIASASALHDVGKIGIPDTILTKPGKLTPEEWEVMKTHSVLGCEILNYLDSTIEQEYLRYAYNICRYHHERWDGKGYPDGLRGEDIPICAQVVGLTDCYDALTSDRVYKERYSHAQAVNMILGGECGAFSPKLLECFKNATGAFAALSAEYADGRNPAKPIADISLPALPSREQTSNLMEKTQAKYFAMVHYLNAFLVELQYDTGLFQVIYNPYPELAPVKGMRSFQELIDLVACQIVVPEEKEQVYRVLQEEVPEFISRDLRRQSFFFHYRPFANEPGGAFEMTFLRIGGLNRRPSLAILARKADGPRGLSFRDDSLMQNFTECTYVCRNDDSFTLVRAGKDTHSLGGYTPEEVMTIFGGRLLDMAFPEERAQIRREFDRQLKNGPIVRTEYRFLCKDGSIGWVNNKSRLVLGEDGKEYIQTFLMDITSIKTAYSQLSEVITRYQTILAQTENMLFDLDLASGCIELSETWEGIFGYKPTHASLQAQLSGETHVHPDDIALLKDRLFLMTQGSNYEMVEIRIATHQGRYLWCRVRGSAKRDENGKLTQILGIIINIDPEKKALQALEDKATRDSLTKLLNKNAGKQQVEQYLTLHRGNLQCALLILDLDNFKEINDRYGHLFGDALLTQLSQILTSLFHSHDIVARIGGDEFMVLVRGINDRHLLASQCHRLRDMLLHTFRGENLDLELGFSIGIALCPEHGNSYYELISKADQALYHVKAQGKNDFCFYHAENLVHALPSARPTTPIDSDAEVSALHTAVSYQVFQILYGAKDISSAINQVLAIIGLRTNVSRVYIFENSEDDRYCRNSFEWCNEGISPEIRNLQHVSYETDIPGYEDNFNEEGVFYCHDVHDLPPAAYQVVEPQGIASMLQCAIRHKGRFRGYIGFDECTQKRLWTKEEIHMLKHLSEILSTFLMMHREQERLQKQSHALREITGLQDRRRYLVEPGSYLLLDSDGFIRESGQTCYQSLKGRDRPCEHCPLPTLQEKDRVWAIEEDARDHSQMLLEAKRCRINGRECFHISCSHLPK